MKTNTILYKKLMIGALLVSAGTVSMLSQAAVTLKVDDNIKVTAINGQEIKQSVFQPLTNEITLQPGQHVITAKYDRLYKLPRKEHDYLRSGNISVAADMVDNQTYRLTMPNQPEEYTAAKEYAKRPTLAVQQNDTIIASQQSMDGRDGGIFSGLGKAIGGVFGGSGDAEIQNQRAIAALDNNKGQATPTVVTSTYQTATPTTVSQTSNTLDSFMQLWLQATPSEREKIRQWVQQ